MGRQDFEDLPKKRAPLFWWFLANILAITFAIISWIVCLNLFRDPTNPTSYKLMMKVGRLEAPAAFSLRDTPVPQQGSDPKELEAQFQSYSRSDLETLNKELRRAYLTNFEKPKFLTYVTGEYRVIGVEKLTEDDFLSPGIVVKAQALIRPDVVADPLPYPVFIECLFPSKDATIESFQVGNTLMLEKQRNCAAILNVGETVFEDRKTVFVTVVPLAAVEQTTESGSTFKITPPAMANPEASLPAFP
ncbi:hypothetical protein OAE39_01690 [Akkermansiaceae bacterium]|nr:hypothetical protein [Akkermansiaceae bacterium]